MQKLVLTSVLLATFILPTVLAGRGERATFSAVLGRFTIITAVYVLLLLLVYPRLF